MLPLNTLKPIFQSVQKPSQYLGNEVNAVHKEFANCRVRVALIFPDAYEMGMSHMGLKILYEILNSIEGVVAERCFAPLPDMEQELRTANLPLFSLESKTPLKEFDIIGITLPYELTFTNALNILDLAQIPVWQKERGEHHPIILAGGTQSYNPEPMADFLDAVAIGDGEELILDVVEKVLDWKQQHSIDLLSQNKNTGSREKLLDDLRKIEGIYVPKFFEPIYKEDGTLSEIKALKADYPNVKKRIVKDLNAQPYPTKLVVPNIKLIHDRIGIEIQRGCTRMCRFCQAGYIERPTRQRSPEKVLEIADESVKNTGIDEISLLSLSAGDYQTIVPTLKELNRRYQNDNINISVPATRTETLTPEMIEQLKKVRMSGFTIAPEAGSERMRRVINKGNKVEDLLKACHNAFSAGYKLIKFYYMCGLPFENDDDVTGIAHEAGEALKVGQTYSRRVEINVSVSSFVPKPFTPFQWEPQMTIEETRRKHHLVKSNLRHRSLNFKHHAPEMSYLEGLFARGDRRLSAVIFQAFKNGCRFDEWTEHFDFRKWQKTFVDTNVDLGFYLHRRREQNEVLPWDHLFSQMKKDWLWQEYLAAAKEAFVADCSTDKCADFCGVCDFKEIKNKIYVIDEKPLAAKKGNRESYGRFGKKEVPPEGSGQASPNEFPVSSGSSILHDREEQPRNNLNETGNSFGDASLPALQDSQLKSVRLRARFSKIGLAALMGHLELMNTLKRAILRNKFQVQYSQGYHPQMKLSMGYALPLGIESDWEFFDLTLKSAVDLIDFTQKMNESLPSGLIIHEVESIDLNAPSIYSMTRSVDYHISFPEFYADQKIEHLKAQIFELTNGKEFFVIREPKAKDRGKEAKKININKYLEINNPTLTKNEGLHFRLLCDTEGSLKPTEVLATLAGVTAKEAAALGINKVGIRFL